MRIFMHRKVLNLVSLVEAWGGEEGQNYHPHCNVSGGKCFYSFVRAPFPGDAFRRVPLKYQSQFFILC